MEPNQIRLGLAAFNAYAASTGGKTHDGKDIPAFDALPQTIRDAWCFAAAAAVEENGKLAREAKDARIAAAAKADK